METNIKKFLVISLSRLNNAEYTNYMTEFRGVIPLTELVITEQVVRYECKELGIGYQLVLAFDEELLKMKDLLRSTTKSINTPLMEEKDAERDSSVRYIRSRAKIEIDNPDETVSQAAVKLTNVLSPYSRVESLPIDQETQVIIGMLFDLDKEENKPLVAALGLTGAVDRLRRQNDEFVELLHQRSAELLSEQKEDSKTVRARMDKVYEEMTAMAQASCLLNPSDTTEKFANELNALIKRTQNLYKQRRGIAAANKDKEENKPIV